MPAFHPDAGRGGEGSLWGGVEGMGKQGLNTWVLSWLREGSRFRLRGSLGV